MISNNRFHTKGANTGKITSFRRFSYLTLSLERNPLPRGMKFCHEKVLAPAADCEGFVILACTFFIGLQSVTDRRQITPRS